MKEQYDNNITDMKFGNVLGTSLATFFLKSCSTALYCNIADGTVRVIEDGGIRGTELADKIFDFREVAVYYARKYVHPEDRSKFLERLSVDYAKENLSENDNYAFNYRERRRGKESTVRSAVLRGEDENHMVVCFCNVTSIFHNEMEQVEMETAHRALVENNRRVMALEDNFESLYDVDLETGECECYTKSMSYSEQVSSKLGARINYFADLQNDIEKVVYKDDREELLKVLNPKYIRKALRKDNHFDWYYRLIIDGAAVWYRIRVVYKNSEKRRVIIGVFHAEDEMREKLREQKLRDELISRMTGGEGLFLIDCVKNTRKTIHDRCYGAGNYTDEEPYSESITKYIDNYVFESDRAMMRAATDPAGMLERLCDSNEYSVEYRDMSSGVLCFYEMKIAKFSDTEILQSFAGKDKEILDRMIFSKMEEQYFALFAVNLDTNTVKVIKNNSNSNIRIAKGGDSADYTLPIKQFVESLDEEPRVFFGQLTDCNYVMKELKREDKHTYSYKSDIKGGSNWIDITSFVILRHDDGTPAIFTMGFSMADSMRANRQESQSRLKEDMQMIGGLASGYHALYYINIDENIFKVYSIDGKRINELEKYVNERGTPAEILTRFGHSELVHPDDRWMFDISNIEQVRERLGHSKKLTLRFRRKIDGEYMWTEMDIIKYEDIDERANVMAVGFAVRDTEIRRELEQQRLLEEAMKAAEAANDSKTSFLFNMSHDIRTPMNAIIGFATLAKKNAEVGSKVMEYLDKIDIAGQQLLVLINQVLEMARIESGKIELEERPINIFEVYNSMITVLAEQATVSKLKFKNSLSGIRHYYVLADLARIGSITMNIAGNAMKYTPAGGSVNLTLKELDCNKEGYARYAFTVADTGIGMSEEFMKVLFEPFSREKNSTISKIQGTGLGMSIVKSLVDIMGGTISVQSKLGKGSKFEVVVDLRIDNKDRKRREPEAERIGASLAGRRILLVEDNEMNREIVKCILEESGLIVDEAIDGDVAVSVMQEMLERKTPNYYDAILMDVQMPKMNGYEATKAIRELLKGEKKRVPIIAMTANAFEKDRLDALAAGMDEHLTKPIDFNKCIQTLQKFIGKKRGGRNIPNK